MFRAVQHAARHFTIHGTRSTAARTSLVRSSQLLASCRDGREMNAFGYSFTTDASATTIQEKPTIKPEKHEFQAETAQLLDIVTHSLYTDKEVFLRELISNASDALEKLRHNQACGETIAEPSEPLEIRIYTRANKNQLVIEDTGIGLTKDEMVMNLGTIARSGSKQFVNKLNEQAQASSSSGNTIASGIIGQFGVGFYSAFMVAETVVVQSIPAAGGPMSVWESTGTGSYTLTEIDDAKDAGGLDGLEPLKRGSRIILNLRDNAKEFCDKGAIGEIIRKYSNFVPFPITVDGDILNTIKAIWAEEKSSVTDQEHKDFYRFVGNTYDDPRFWIHFQADAPLAMKTLLYFPRAHTEKFGMGRMEPGVSLYSKKVLIEHKSPDILPPWLRFVKGVIDSEDLPLSISREKAQDTRLVAKVRDIVVRKVIRHLQQMLRKDRKGYEQFFEEFGVFLKEGVCQDYQYQRLLAPLLLFESTALGPGQYTTLDEYIGRMDPSLQSKANDKDGNGKDQQGANNDSTGSIYYLCAPSRSLAESSPYLEAFKGAGDKGKGKGREVVLFYNAIDDFVMTNLHTYLNRTLVSAEAPEAGDILSAEEEDKENEEEEAGDGKTADKDSTDEKNDGNGSASAKAVDLSVEERAKLCDWIRNDLLGPAKVKSVSVTNRLRHSPAVITEHESGALRRMMRFVEQQNAGDGSGSGSGGNEGAGLPPLPPQKLEVNPKHPLLLQLHQLRLAAVATSGSGSGSGGFDGGAGLVVAKLVAEQLYDNCLLSAGLMDDGRVMVPRLNTLLTEVVTRLAQAQNTTTTTTTTASSSSSSSSTATAATAIPVDASESGSSSSSSSSPPSTGMTIDVTDDIKDSPQPQPAQPEAQPSSK